MAREWLAGLACVSLIVAPLGCTIQFADPSDLGGGGSASDYTSSPGLFVNPNVADKTMAGARSRDGHELFVFGTRNSDGSLAEVESIVVFDRDGNESFITFESGRPAHIEGADGSYIDIVYTTVSSTKLAATAVMYSAADGSTQTLDAEIDLQQTAEQVAQALEQLTGLSVELPDTGALETGKLLGQAQSITIISLFVLPLLFGVTLMVLVGGQVLEAVFQGISNVAYAIFTVIFAPFRLIGAILNDATVTIQPFPLADVFGFVPPPPIVVET